MSDRDAGPSPATKGVSDRSFTVRQLAAGLLGLVMIIFIAQNRESTDVVILFMTVTLPLWLILAATALLGMAVAWLIRRKRPKTV